MTLIAAAVQFRPRFARCRADVQNNIRLSEALVHDAWKVGANLVVFPELAMTGYSFLSRDEAAQVAEPAGTGVTSKAMALVASELKAHVVWGMVESYDDSLFNSAAVASPDGTVAILSRKLNLWGNDFLWATPSPDPPTTIQTEFGGLTALVCRDLRGKKPKNRPRVASSDLVPLEATIIAAPVNWGGGGFPAVTWMDLVSSSGRPLVVADRWGVEENGDFSNDFGNGGSIIIEPSWKTHTGGLKFKSDCVVSARLEMNDERQEPAVRA